MQKPSLFSALAALSEEIRTEKTAAQRPQSKQAGSPVPADPGGYNGASSHPTASVDNRGQSASEGSRSSENVSDVNADQGSTGVNKAPDAQPGQEDSVQLNIGTTQSATGEDPSVEDDYKGGKDDPGSTMPARTDNDALDGHKYASASLGACLAVHTQLADGILADLANGQGRSLSKEALAKATAGRGNMSPSAAGTNPPAAPRTQMAGSAPAGQKLAGAQPSSIGAMIQKAARAVQAGKISPDSPAAGNVALEAGYSLAAALGVEKQAAQEAVAELIENTINDAHIDADLFGAYYNTFRRKHAGDDAGEGEDHNHPGDDTSGANDAEGTGGETGGPGGGEMGGDAGGGGSLGDLLGGGGDPGGLAGAGGPPGGGGGDPMGGVGKEEAVMQLVSALDELGIPLETLMSADGGMGGGMGGDPAAGGMPGGPPPGGDPMMGGAPPMGGPPPGGDPMMGGAPPMGGGAPPMGEGMKLASVIKAFKRSGNYQFKAANTGTRERELRDTMKSYLRELVPASR